LGDFGFDLGARKSFGEISDPFNKIRRINDGLGTGEESFHSQGFIANRKSGSFLQKAPQSRH
jgi:hypothetical protein